MSLFVDVELPVTAIPPGGVIALRADVTLELERVVPTESTAHYLWLVGESYGQFLADLRDDPAIEAVAVLDEYDDRVLVRLDWTGLETPFLELLDQGDVVLVEARGTTDGWTATLRFPDETALATFYRASEQRGLGVDLRAVNGARFDERGDASLSGIQQATLEAAFEAGYFDIPRSVTLAELAARLDRSEQAVSEALRRGIGNYLRATVREQQTAENGGRDEVEASNDGPRDADSDTDENS